MFGYFYDEAEMDVLVYYIIANFQSTACCVICHGIRGDWCDNASAGSEWTDSTAWCL